MISVYKQIACWKRHVKTFPEALLLIANAQQCRTEVRHDVNANQQRPDSRSRLLVEGHAALKIKDLTNTPQVQIPPTRICNRHRKSNILMIELMSRYMHLWVLLHNAQLNGFVIENYNTHDVQKHFKLQIPGYMVQIYSKHV